LGHQVAPYSRKKIIMLALFNIDHGMDRRCAQAAPGGDDPTDGKTQP
jgi:hypothetical protein